jgi:hypothetical protein
MCDDNKDQIKLYEILVPCNWNNGKPIRTRHHKQWDEQVKRIAGGITIFKPSIGKWVSPEGTTYIDRMIPVRVACTAKQIEEIIRRTIVHYDQEAVMAYKISEEVKIVHRN